MNQSAPKAGVSRRRVLRTFGLVGITGVAGCSRSQADPLSPTKGEGGSKSVFQSLSFELGDLVITLPEDHDVSQISLIAPDGTAFASVAPDFGVRTVRIATADPQVGRADYVHYKPGVHELVAQVGEETQRRKVELRPELSVSAVTMSRESNQPADLGKVSVRIQNDGTAPTWPFDIAFDGAPNWTVNRPIKQSVGIPMDGNLSEQAIIIPPGEEREFTSVTPPVLFEEDSSVQCSGEEYAFRVLIGVASGDVLSQTVRVATGGERLTATLSGRFACDESTLEVVDERT